jgi:hypothetical protein
MNKLLLALAFTVATASSAAAEIHTHPGANVSIDIPSSWTVTKDKTGMLLGRSKDDAVGLMFWVVDTTDAQKAIALLDKQLAGKFTDVKWPGGPKKFDKNGLSGIRNAGTAKVNGKDAVVLVGVAGGKKLAKGVIVFGAIDVAQAKAHSAELEGIFDSLKATR